MEDCSVKPQASHWSFRPCSGFQGKDSPWDKVIFFASFIAPWRERRHCARAKREGKNPTDPLTQLMLACKERSQPASQSVKEF